jgi:lipoprotein-anchoring transpeptidase ErfK/SrfK
MIQVLAFVLTLFATTSGTAAATPPNTGLVTLAASTKKNILELRVGGKRIRRYDVSVGKKGFPTPSGKFTVNHIVWNPSWVPPKEKWAKGKAPAAPGSEKNPMKVVKIFFKEPDYYIHGTGDEEALGGAASHGCIRMSQRDAFALGRYLMDHGGAAHDDAWYANVFNRGKSADVRLPRYVTIVIGP